MYIYASADDQRLAARGRFANAPVHSVSLATDVAKTNKKDLVQLEPDRH